ncbi:glycosyltransferase [Dysgonomonas termitidis]|uniref:Glycosyltransferase n=1 Tax=Dysgonomonas termitidis TaxID=1516126 RepID=A0ABV9KRB8_9BACT
MEDKPIRVLMLFTILNRGGAETMVINYLRRIDRSKVIFDFIVHRSEKGAYDDEVEKMGCRIYRFPPLKLLRIPSYKRYISDFFDLHREYKIIHGHCSELGYYIYKEAHRRGLPFIAAHAHNEPHGLDIKTPVRNILKWRMRPYLTHYFTCSQGSAKWLFGKPLMEKAILFPNAIDTCRFVFNPVKRKEIRVSYGWEGKLVIGNISRFSYQKNHLFLLDIFSIVARCESSALLVLVGSGGELQKRVKEKVLQLGLKNKVKIMGSRADIPDLLQGMDLFLFPSLFEGLSVAQLEAQASGLKIINSTSVSEEGTIIPELVESLSLKLTAGQWAERVLQSITGYERKNRMQEITDAGFDINRNAEWLQDLYIRESRY